VGRPVRRATKSATARSHAEGIGIESCSPGFRGCPFINAAAEYADAEHPVRQAVEARRRWFKHTIEEMLAEIGVTDVSTAADQLVMLRDGAIVAGYLGGPRGIARSLYCAVIEKHTTSGGRLADRRRALPVREQWSRGLHVRRPLPQRSERDASRWGSRTSQASCRDRAGRS
jgi:hypothetical protein